VDSGLMIAQYTAAGIVSDLKRLAVPASVDSIPSSAMQEDHVSMGWAAARKLRRSVDGLTRVLAIELLASTRALDFRTGDDPAAGAAVGAPSPVTAAVRALLRTDIEAPGADTVVSTDIARAVEYVRSGRVETVVEDALGPLG